MKRKDFKKLISLLILCCLIFTSSLGVVLADDEETPAEETAVSTGPTEIVVVTPEVEIDPNTKYCVDCEIENVSLDGKDSVKYHMEYSGTIIPDEGFEYPEKVTVKIGDKKTSDFSYDNKTGAFTIAADLIDGDVTIGGTAEELIQFNVVSKITNCVLYGSKADYKDGYIGTIKPNAGFALPEKIFATMNEEPFGKFTYDNKTGVIKINGFVVEGELKFSGDGVLSLESGYFNMLSVVSNGKASILDYSPESSIEIIITPNEGYNLPENILITSNNTRFLDFKYDSFTGIITIGSDKVRDIIIAAECSVTSVTMKYVKENPVSKVN